MTVALICSVPGSLTHLLLLMAFAVIAGLVPWSTSREASEPLRGLSELAVDFLPCFFSRRSCDGTEEGLCQRLPVCQEHPGRPRARIPLPPPGMALPQSRTLRNLPCRPSRPPGTPQVSNQAPPAHDWKSGVGGPPEEQHTDTRPPVPSVAGP